MYKIQSYNPKLRHIKKQENMTQTKENRQQIEFNLEMIQTLELVSNVLKKLINHAKGHKRKYIHSQ